MQMHLKMLVIACSKIPHQSCRRRTELWLAKLKRLNTRSIKLTLRALKPTQNKTVTLGQTHPLCLNMRTRSQQPPAISPGFKP